MAQNQKNHIFSRVFAPRFARALSLRAPHAGFAGMWGTTTLRARFARGSLYLIVFNLLSPLNVSPPSSIPPPLSLFSAPPLPLLSSPNEKPTYLPTCLPQAGAPNRHEKTDVLNRFVGRSSRIIGPRDFLQK